jgi:hypothetical protein
MAAALLITKCPSPKQKQTQTPRRRRSAQGAGRMVYIWYMVYGMGCGIMQCAVRLICCLLRAVKRCSHQSIVVCILYIPGLYYKLQVTVGPRSSLASLRSPSSDICPSSELRGLLSPALRGALGAPAPRAARGKRQNPRKKARASRMEICSQRTDLLTDT